jgi:hypothetical protein
MVQKSNAKLLLGKSKVKVRVLTGAFASMTNFILRVLLLQ